MEAIRTLSQVEAERLQASDAELFRRSVPPGAQLGGSAPNQAVIRLTHEILSSPESVERADGLSRILRTVDVHRSFILEYVCGSPPYGQLTPHLRVTLQNISNRTIKVIRGVRVVPVLDSDGTVSGERRNVLEIYKRLDPGEQITVDADRAVHILQKHSRQGTQPALWAAAKKDEIIEVGYTASWIDVDTNGEAVATEVKSPPEVVSDAIRTKGRRRNDQP